MTINYLTIDVSNKKTNYFIVTPFLSIHHYFIKDLFIATYLVNQGLIVNVILNSLMTSYLLQVLLGENELSVERLTQI